MTQHTHQTTGGDVGRRDHQDDEPPWPEEVNDRYNVHNGHLLRGTERGADTIYGPGPFVEWRCIGCGRDEITNRRDLDPCPDPALWVVLGTPADGLAYCPDCQHYWPLEYGEHGLTDGCPECGSLDWVRDDDPPVEVDDVAV